MQLFGEGGVSDYNLKHRSRRATVWLMQMRVLLTIMAKAR